MTSHTLSNSVFLKNLSPLLTTEGVRDFLLPHLPIADEILSIEFKFFSGSTQRYCQVDFRTSAGVTAATALNGQCLLGVPLVITVIDPASSTAIHPLLGAGAPLFSGASAAGASLFPASSGQPSSTGLPLGLRPFSGLGYLARETEAQQLARTVHVANVPPSWDLRQVIDRLATYIKQHEIMTLVVTDSRLVEGTASDLSDRFALLEVKTVELAEALRRLPLSARQVGDRELVITQAKVTATPREPDNVSFDLPPSVPVPVAYQQLNKLKLQEKIARARALAERITTAQPRDVIDHDVRKTSSRPDRRSESVSPKVPSEQPPSVQPSSSVSLGQKSSRRDKSLSRSRSSERRSRHPSKRVYSGSRYQRKSRSVSSPNTTQLRSRNGSDYRDAARSRRNRSPSHRRRSVESRNAKVVNSRGSSSASAHNVAGSSHGSNSRTKTEAPEKSPQRQRPRSGSKASYEDKKVLRRRDTATSGKSGHHDVNDAYRSHDQSVSSRRDRTRRASFSRDGTRRRYRDHRYYGERTRNKGRAITGSSDSSLERQVPRRVHRRERSPESRLGRKTGRRDLPSRAQNTACVSDRYYTRSRSLSHSDAARNDVRSNRKRSLSPRLRAMDRHRFRRPAERRRQRHKSHSSGSRSPSYSKRHRDERNAERFTEHIDDASLHRKKAELPRPRDDNDKLFASSCLRTEHPRRSCYMDLDEDHHLLSDERQKLRFNGEKQQDRRLSNDKRDPSELLHSARRHSGSKNPERRSTSPFYAKQDGVSEETKKPDVEKHNERPSCLNEVTTTTIQSRACDEKMEIVEEELDQRMRELKEELRRTLKRPAPKPSCTA